MKKHSDQRATARGKSASTPPVMENRRARFRYDILETFEAGIALLGSEVKSLRRGGAHIGDSYALPKGGELYLLNLHIEPYENGGAFNHEEKRSRKLLLKRAEIDRLQGQIEQRRLSLIPVKLYFNQRGKVKVLLALGRGKKLVDRRESEKKADAEREIARALRDMEQQRRRY